MSLLFHSALLVEDELHLATALQVAMRKLSIPTEHAPTLTQAREYLKHHIPEFILLDRTLPDGEGLDLCAELRSHHYRGIILILTAAGQIEDRVTGLNVGADDYLPKPFSWEELEARIKALARRKAPQAAHNNPLFKDSGSVWQLDPKRLRILGHHGWVELTPLEFKLATRLMQAEGQILTRDELLKEVWGFTLLPKTRTVDHFLGRLRKHFEENPEAPKHFLTIRGAGYRFAAG